MVQAKFSLVNRPLSPPAQTINEMGGNVPGGEFSELGEFPRAGGGGVCWVEIFQVRIFLGVDFPETKIPISFFPFL